MTTECREVIPPGILLDSLMSSGFGDHSADDSGSYGSHDEVTIDLTPLVAAWWFMEMVLAPVYALTAPPIFLTHVVALLPLLMVNIVMGIMMVLSKGCRLAHKRRGGYGKCGTA
jgi:hypothetical protein